MGKIISLVSCKGGLGKSTIAINLAEYLRNNKKEVLLVDADTLNPSINFYLGLNELNVYLQDVLENKAHFSDSIVKTKTGLMVSLSSGNSSKGDFSETLGDMKNFADYIIVNAPSGMSKHLLDCIDVSDDFLLVTDAEEVSINNSKSILFESKKLKKEPLGILVNKVLKTKNELSDFEISERLNYPVIFKVPFDKKVKFSHNLNSSAIITYPKSKFSKKLSEAGLFFLEKYS